MTRKRCSRCGFFFWAVNNEILCKGCSNGHGTDREMDAEITEALDELFGLSKDPEDPEE